MLTEGFHLACSFPKYVEFGQDQMKNIHLNIDNKNKLKKKSKERERGG